MLRRRKQMAMMRRTVKKDMKKRKTPLKRRKRREVSIAINEYLSIDRKKKKTGEGGSGDVVYEPREQDNSRFRLLGSW